MFFSSETFKKIKNAIKQDQIFFKVKSVFTSVCQTGQSSRNNYLAADERQVQEVERTVSGHLAECNVVDAKLVGARQDLRVGMNTSCYLTQNDAVRKHIHLRTPHAMAK